MTHWLNKNLLTYAFRFGLIVAFAKGLLRFSQHGAIHEMLWDMALYFAIAAILAIPLFFFKQERTRSGVVMDQIVLLCIGIVVACGMLHDQVAVRVSPEYFTIGHFPISGIHDETLLALVWGVMGTWWLGAGLGMILAMVACAGEQPKFPPSRILQLIILPLLIIEIISWLMATIGFYLTKQGIIGLAAGGYAHLVPQAKHAFFMANWWANGTAYSLVSIGCILLCRQVWQYRTSTAIGNEDGKS